MKSNNTMRLAFLFLAASTVSAKYEGFFGKPTSNVEANEKTRRIEQQLRQSFGASDSNSNNKKLKNSGNVHPSGPRGAKPKPEEKTPTTDEKKRALKYYEPYYPPYYENLPYYYEPPYYPEYPEHLPYYPEEDYYYPKYPEYKYPVYYPSKKSMMGGKMKGGKMWGGKMKGSMKWQGKWKNKWQSPYPPKQLPIKDHILDMVFQDDAVFGPILDDEDCELFVAAEAFAFGGYTANVTVTPDGTGGPGTQYIWQPDYMQDRYTTDLIDATFSGYCILTSFTDAYCNFVIVNNVGDQITLAGTLTTPTLSTESAGTLAITGGTGAMAGVIGEAEVYANPIGNNVFELATRFDVDVILGVIVCKPQALPVY